VRFRPTTASKLPCILLRTPYDKGTAMTDNYRPRSPNTGTPWWCRTCAGRYGSGGRFDPLNQEIDDGDDTLDWIAKQAW
jgi:predicted acyl esterase